MHSVSKRVVSELALFLVLLGVAVALTWPLAANLGTALPDLSDPVLNAWIIDWDIHALTHAPLHLFDAPIYDPARYPLAFSENLLGIALLMLPFHAVGLTAVAVLNIAVLLGFAFSAWGMTVLTRTVGRSLFASFIAGVLFAFSGFAIEHLPHVQIIWSGWLPLMFAAIFAYWKTPTPGRAALLGCALLMNGLTNIHWLLFGSFALVSTIVFLAVADPRRTFRFWALLAGALCVASLLLLPILIPYRVVSDLYGMRRIRSEIDGGSASWTDWLVSNPRSWLWQLQPDNNRPERRLFPGVMLTLLAASGLFFTGREKSVKQACAGVGPRVLLRILDALIIVFFCEAYLGTVSPGFVWTIGQHLIVSLSDGATPFAIAIVLLVVRFTLRLPDALGGSDGSSLRDVIARSRFTPQELSAALWIAIGVLGSFGTNSFFHTVLFEHVEAFSSIRTPARWAVLAYLGMAVWSALGIDAILSAVPSRGRALSASFIAVLVLLDVAPHTRWEHALAKPAPVYTWLRDQTVRGPILELPMSGWNFPFPYLLASTTHHVPIMNGTSGFEPPLHSRLREMTGRREYNDVLLALLEANHCRYVIVHPDWLQDQVDPALRWLQGNAAAGHLALVRRFDHDMNGDYVFALTREGSDWARLTRPAFRDAAGYTDRENFDRLVQGSATYTASTFGRIEEPRMDADIHGNLHVRGWALSPDGVRRVTLLVHSGKYRFALGRELRPDVSLRWPWYPRVPQPGFVADLPKRPKGMPRLTDLQVEVEDGKGGITRFTDVLVSWD